MEPVGGVWVVLHRVGPDHAGPLDSLQSDSRGRYAFRYVRSGSEDALYFVSAMYDGIAYFTAPLTQANVSGDDGEITVFDTTSGHVPLSVRGHHVVVSAADANAQRSIVEVYDLSNDSSVTRVAVGDDAAGATWKTHIPAGAADFKVGEGDISAAAVTHSPNGLVSVFAPLAPGIKQLSFSYSLPARAFPLKLPLEAPTAVYEIMVEEKTGTVAAPHLKEVDPVTVDERNFRRFLGTDVPENSLAVIDLPAPPPTHSIDSRYLVALTLVIGGAMVLALAQALRRR